MLLCIKTTIVIYLFNLISVLHRHETLKSRKGSVIVWLGGLFAESCSKSLRPVEEVADLRSSLDSLEAPWESCETWPSDMRKKRAKKSRASVSESSDGEEPRPATASLEAPLVLDPRLVDKLDMSLISKVTYSFTLLFRDSRYRTILGGLSRTEIVASIKIRVVQRIHARFCRHIRLFSFTFNAQLKNYFNIMDVFQHNSEYALKITFGC